MLNVLNRVQSRSGRRESEAGVTVIELVVVTALMTLVLVASFGALVSMQKNTKSTTDRFTATSEAQVIADRLTKDLRAAVTTSVGGSPFTKADASEVQFYADLGRIYNDPVLGNQPGPTKLHVYLSTIAGTNTKELHEDATPPKQGTVGNYVFDDAMKANRIDGKYIDISQPLFTYYRYSTTAPTELEAIPQSSYPITDTATLQNIVAVGLNVRVRVTPTAPVAVIDTLVHIRNVDYNPQ